MPKGVNRLFKQFVPSSYVLTLDINEDALTFSGTVKINGKKVGRPSKRLTFHQKELKITAARIKRSDKKGVQEFEVSRINNHNGYNEVRLHTEAQLFPGEYEVELEFNGEVTRPMHGIYPCFFDHKGKSKKLIMSQFEPHYAREGFPCIDEPEAKALFNLKLITAENQVVLSNTPMKTQSKKAGRLHTTFETSPLMSTYLLAFVFGELHCVSAKTKNGVEVNSWATVAQPKEHLRFSNKEAVNVLEFFEGYFKTPFPLKKLDNVAVPDFDALAMENWGLITYREVGLLADPVNRSISGEQLISMVISHEISHQWFGNLVTMRWWNDLWLNESFAELVQNVAMNALHPEWQVWEDFTSGRMLSGSHRDIYKDVQPVEVEVNHPDEIDSAFDPAIVYAKGSRLIAMLVEYIGEEAFRNGLKDYFKEHAFSNTVGDDLWRALSVSAKQDIGKLMTPWIKQSGQPLLSVKNDGKKLSLKQKRFLIDGDDSKSLWPIPLLSEPQLDLKLLDKRSVSIDYAHKETPLFNVSGNGHFITFYEDDSAKEALRDKVTKRTIGSSSRIIALSDMLLLARAGKYDMAYLLKLVDDANEEPRDAVWSMLARIAGQAQTLTDGDRDIEENFRRFKAKLVAYWYEKLGWTDKPDDDANTKHLRSTALALSLAGEYEPAVTHALKLYDKLGSAEKLPAEQQAMIVSVVTKRGKPKDIEALKKEYETIANQDVKESIASGMCATRDPKLASELIKWGLSEGGVIRPQDMAHWFAYLMRNSYTREVTWKWFTSSWDYLLKISGGGKHMEYFVWYASGALSTTKWQERFKDFFEPKLKQKSLKRNILIAFSEIEARVEWRKREESSIKKYISQF